MNDLALALRVIDDSWEEARVGLFNLPGAGAAVTRLPELTEEAAIAASARAQALLDRTTTLDVDALPVEVATTLAVAKDHLHRQSLAGRWWWTLFDPLGVGFWSLYAPTAYAGGFVLSTIARVLAAQPLETPGDLDRYLGLVEDYARIVRQLDARTRGQAERGIHVPRVQLEQAVTLVDRLRAAAPASIVRGEGRTRRRIADRVAEVVDPAFQAMQSWLREPERLAAAPEAVGMASLPDGDELYAELVKQHLTLDRSVESVHEYGLQRVAQIRADMQVVADELGEQDAAAVLRRLEGDPAWHAETPEGIAAFFDRYIERMKPHVETQFRFRPQADYSAVPLSAALSTSMTFGFYDKPGPGEPTGRYLFNAVNLAQQPLANIAALNFHELVPGHHLHMATQAENDRLHPLRVNAFVNAFNEGWAEYAGGLAGELGLYELPEERFGRLMMDAFLTTRLVVDTGMNALGWTLEQAREYMRENAFVSEAEMLTESVRYSCDMPGQSLAYKMGEPFLLEQRERMRTALGDRFDIRDFHDAVLRPGALPLSEVAKNVDRAIVAANDPR